jgi:RNA-directed DNA polymerase
MKEPYGKGLATRPGAKSCAGHGNMAGEALTRARAGQPLSSEIIFPVCRPCSDFGKGDTMSDAKRKPFVDAAESETLCIRGNSLHGNRGCPRGQNDFSRDDGYLLPGTIVRSSGT